MDLLKDSFIADLRMELKGRMDGGPSAGLVMPAAFYTSDAFLEIEKDTVFRSEWVCLGHAGEIPNPGDYFTTEFLDEPLLVVRDDAGDVRVLSNVCRHRGNLVASGRGNRKRFSCPYHAWSYGRDGQLMAAPMMDGVPGFDKKACRLPSLKMELWNNFIFVNLDGEAAPLGPRLSGLDALGRNYHMEERNFLHAEDDNWGTNWKCLTENFMEGYHLSITHRKTLHNVTPTKLCRKVPGGEGYTAYISGYAPTFPERTPNHPDLTEDERKQSLLFCIYPSFVATTAPNCTLFMCLQPDGASRVQFRWGVIGHPADPGLPEVQDYIALTRAFSAEDREKMETLQKGLKSRYYQPGFLGPDDLEGTIKDFYRYIMGRLGE